MFENTSILWQEIQAHYFREIGKQNSELHWTSVIIHKIWKVAWDQWEHRNAILHKYEKLVTQAEAVMIASQVQMELETEIQGLLQGDNYLFDDRRVSKSTKLKVNSQVNWLDTVAEARQMFTVSLTQLWGLFNGRS
jgi:hypothetical protein